MRNMAFIPVSIGAGIVGGILARKAFDQAWAIVDREEPPSPDQRDASWPKLLIALALEGAITTAVRGAVDHASREGYLRLAGTWPGERSDDD